MYFPFLKDIKCPQTKFNVDTMSDSKVLGQKKCQNLSLGQYSSLRQSFLAAQLFFFYQYLLKLQQLILMCFCKFSCNSDIIIGLLRLLT